MTTINKKIKNLEIEVKKLKSKLFDLSKNVESKVIPPYTKIGASRDRSQIRPVDIETGLGQAFGGNLIFNDSELNFPPYGDKPSEPTKGYNKHSHSKYAGGALDINSVEFVDYDADFETSLLYNKHCQGFWLSSPPIKKVTNSQGQSVEKIGNLDIEYDPDTRKWKASGGIIEIDIDNTYFVKYIWKKDGDEVPAGTEGATREVKTDENGNLMKSPLVLYEETVSNETKNKANAVWDKDAQCFRLYAVFKPYIED